MMTAKSTLPLIVLSMTVVSPPTFAETIYLEATFDDKPLDMPIGTGGAELGEPVEVDFSVIATVRGTPMPSPCLELRDNDDFVSGSADFEFIGSAAENFTNLRFDPDGSVWHWDENNTSGVILGSYEIGRVYPVSLVFDMDAGTYDVWLDGLLALDDEDHGITGRGVGSLLFGCRDDPDLESLFSVDDILVGDTFTPVVPRTWGEIKGLFRSAIGTP